MMGDRGRTVEEEGCVTVGQGRGATLKEERCVKAKKKEGAMVENAGVIMIETEE